uniref:MADF domain-containing protein n=1 Tax=Oryzias latipes TaxID=8090 RepID=A0A3P9LG74_ORYLA
MQGKMNVELLVLLVLEHKELYDKRDSDYKNLDKRELLWSGIAQQMGLDVEEVKHKWKSLRDTYTRKKHEDDCRSGQAAKNNELWKFMKVMEFLDITIHSCVKARESEKEERRREKEERREQRREQQNDENYLFALGLIPALRRLSPAVQSSVKLKITSAQSPVTYHQVPPHTPTNYGCSTTSWLP